MVELVVLFGMEVYPSERPARSMRVGGPLRSKDTNQAAAVS
jgi:hypothetical protein